MTLTIPAVYVYHGELSGRPVVYVQDVALVVAGHLEKMAAKYPADVFPDSSTTPDAYAGTALRLVLTREAKRLRMEATL